MNIKKIIEAWMIANNPTDEQKELAELRANVCENCPSNIKVVFHLCNECGCPIAKKIFTNDFNACPLQKWNEIDDKYFPNRKKEKTLF